MRRRRRGGRRSAVARQHGHDLVGGRFDDNDFVTDHEETVAAVLRHDFDGRPTAASADECRGGTAVPTVNEKLTFGEGAARFRPCDRLGYTRALLVVDVDGSIHVCGRLRRICRR